MKNQSEIIENKENYRGGVKWYREKIVEIINETEDLKYLEFIHKLLLSFKKKWGV